ncbi:MAG: hypothetical protein JRN08_07130, partial [Nitrososphaerota archaeon]|nr:hypothetical protein [Nitrososphaerota archaeon]
MPLDTVDSEKLTAVLRQFQGRKVLVVGDLMVSRFVDVAARKLAREAPVPAGDFVGQVLLPGGAANLSRELTSLGASVGLVGLIGSDEYGSWLKTEFGKYGLSSSGVITDAARPTSLRTWYMVNGFHALRVDKEDRRDAPLSLSKKLLAEAEPQIKDVDCVMLSDYDRGAITSYLIGGVVSAARAAGKIVVGQPKMHHYLDFSGVTYVKSNLEEAEQALLVENLCARVDLPMNRVEVRTDEGGDTLELSASKIAFKECLMLTIYGDEAFGAGYAYDAEDVARARRNEEQAARDGLKAHIEHPFTGDRVPLWAFLRETLDRLDPLAEAL